jgi:hypothetical protein
LNPRSPTAAGPKPASFDHSDTPAVSKFSNFELVVSFIFIYSLNGLDKGVVIHGENGFVKGERRKSLPFSPHI